MKFFFDTLQERLVRSLKNKLEFSSYGYWKDEYLIINKTSKYNINIYKFFMNNKI